MIDFIIKLEDMLKLAGYPDWKITYVPKYRGYILKLDEEATPVFMCNVGKGGLNLWNFA